jgi:hypothetical protein
MVDGVAAIFINLVDDGDAGARSAGVGCHGHRWPGNGGRRGGTVQRRRLLQPTGPTGAAGIGDTDGIANRRCRPIGYSGNAGSYQCLANHLRDKYTSTRRASSSHHAKTAPAGGAVRTHAGPLNFASYDTNYITDAGRVTLIRSIGGCERDTDAGDDTPGPAAFYTDAHFIGPATTWPTASHSNHHRGSRDGKPGVRRNARITP